jgi:MFS family permease
VDDTQKLSDKWQIPFFSIWTGQTFSLVGSRVAQFALIWWLTKLTGSATVLATASLAALIPEILLGPLAGVYVDRWNRRMVMIVADGLVALAALWLAYLFWMDAIQIWHVYVIMVVRAVGGQFPLACYALFDFADGAQASPVACGGPQPGAKWRVEHRRPAAGGAGAGVTALARCHADRRRDGGVGHHAAPVCSHPSAPAR